ncbi:MAG: MltA domain-containing protein [Pseudomonadota bacterium]
MLFNFFSSPTSLLPTSLIMLSLLVGCSTTSVERPATSGPGSATPTPGVAVAPGTMPQSSTSSAATPPTSPAAGSTTVSPAVVGGNTLRQSTYAAIPGWNKDDLRDAWPAFKASCDVLVRRVEWRDTCLLAQDMVATDTLTVRKFFETQLVPHQVLNVDGTSQGLVTGYYEPLLRGSRKRSEIYQTPLHRPPPDLLNVELATVYPELKTMRLRGRMSANKILPYWTRAELTQNGILAGKELLWVDDPIDAFFLQVQGSGRVQLADSKETVRVSYAEQNGHPYKSIGRYLVDRGELTLEQASAQSIKAWYAANPVRRQELLNANPSYVFFREEKLSDPNIGPKGSLGVPLTPHRSIAVDPQYVPLGAPVFLSTTQPNTDTALQRLMMAQDTGGAIRNAVRADFFWGFGPAAGEQAGKMKQRGMMWVLLPKSSAIAFPQR